MDPGESDLERPLNHRGERDAPLTGERLKEQGIAPDCIVCSPAVRARMTAILIANALGYDPGRILIQNEVYEHGQAALMKLIQGFNQNWHRVFLIGHNPDLTHLINRLSGENITHLPTCGVASIEFAADDWSHIMEGSGRLEFFDYPKRHVKTP